jgi:pimeloyl-ACP methyl ester carboxylesterase
MKPSAACVIAVSLWVTHAAAAGHAVTRADHHVGGGDEGVSLFVRELRAAGDEGGVPVILMHGARVPGVASFDLPVAHGSLAAELAAAGHRVFVMDARGYGGSTRPAAMDATPDGQAPLVRSDEVVRDLGAVVEWVRARTGRAQVALVGWAAGGHWCGMYAALHPDRVSHLVVVNALYGATAATPHPLLGGEPPHAGYALAPAASLLRPWDANIPGADKARWRDPAVASAYVAAALASDPTSGARTPPSLRAPLGALEDSVYLAAGRQLWDASLVRAATLIVRSERDFWSRPEDVERLTAHLTHAARVRVVRLADATHFVHLDRPERGRALLLAALFDWLAH